MTCVIYHNPDCGTSRNVLEMLRQSGETPEVIEYLKTPPTRARLVELLASMAIAPRELLRRKEPLCAEQGLEDETLGDEPLIDAMMAHPILINRPIVVTEHGARLCRPSEQVLALLDQPLTEFKKEDGEVVRFKGVGHE
ncbi:arsenate reductase (glutaredoxin) [Kushneria sp. TE3]|uniref:arsenate reductase (glutaredoxin) n=1 Tax=Kushneria sp. TE3 TaxID=3449832 RepID=UPI003F687292